MWCLAELFYDYQIVYHFTTLRQLGLLLLFFLLYFSLTIFFCYLDNFCMSSIFRYLFVSLYIFSYLAFELQVCLINSVQFSSVQQA